MSLRTLWLRRVFFWLHPSIFASFSTDFWLLDPPAWCPLVGFSFISLTLAPRESALLAAIASCRSAAEIFEHSLTACLRTRPLARGAAQEW